LNGQGARVIASSTIVVPRGESFAVVSDAVARATLEGVLVAFAAAIEPRAATG